MATDRWIFFNIIFIQNYIFYITYIYKNKKIWLNFEKKKISKSYTRFFWSSFERSFLNIKVLKYIFLIILK